MVRWADNLTGVDDILGSDAVDGRLVLNLGDAITGQGSAAECPALFMDGFASRPNPVDSTGAPGALYIVDGEDKLVVSTWDRRHESQVGALDPGDRMIYSKGPQRVLVKEATKSITLLSENDETGTNMWVHVGGTDGMVQLLNDKTYVEVSKNSITLAVNGGGAIVINGDGVTVTGKMFVAATKSGQLGVGPTPTTPLPPGVNSVLAGPSGPTAAPSASWTVATV